MTIFFTMVFFLTACGASAPQVTVTRFAEVTVTSLPTATIPPTVTLTINPTFTATPDLTAKLPQSLLDMGLPAADLIHYSVDASGNVIDDRFPADTNSEYAQAYVKTAEGLQLGHIYYGNWQVGADGKFVLDANGRPVAKEVSTDNLLCVQEGTPCVKDDVSKIYDVESYVVDGISTGAFEHTLIRDPKTQEVVGLGDVVVIQTVGGQFRILVQWGKLNSPTINNEGWLLAIVNKSAITKQEAQTVVSSDRLSEILPAGHESWWYFAKEYKVRMKEFVEGLNFGYEAMKYVYADQDILDEQNRVLEGIQNGETISTNLPYLYSSTVGGKD